MFALQKASRARLPRIGHTQLCHHSKCMSDRFCYCCILAHECAQIFLLPLDVLKVTSARELHCVPCVPLNHTKCAYEA
jgi:hypothetical protein